MNTLTRRRPSSLGNMRREMDRVLESFLPRTNGPSTNGDADAPRDGSDETQTAVWSPCVDVSETDAAYQVRVDLPGLSKDNLDINYHEGTLSVSGERQMEKAEDGTRFSRIERAYGRFYRSFSLPQAADADKIEAAHENGVLSLHIPKTPESKPRRIDVS
jgi:HSP20 family protein